MRWWLAIFGSAMTGLAVWAYWVFGATALTAVVAVVAIGCLGVLVYVSRLARRSPPIEAPGAPARSGKGQR